MLFSIFLTEANPTPEPRYLVVTPTSNIFSGLLTNARGTPSPESEKSIISFPESFIISIWIVVALTFFELLMRI